MAIKINSNGQSLAAQRQVAQTSDALGRVFERLSSGQRINRASDDAAGLAIADTLNVKSRVFTTGVRNLNDGISLLSVADAAVSSLSDITIRLKELAEQSANGVYSAKQRSALDNEAQALSKEFTRITQSTTFNGLNLFDGSVQGLRLQAGFGTEGGISSSLGGTLGSGTFLPATTLVPAGGGLNPNSISAGDFNRDGIIDLVSSDNSSGKATIFLGVGDGTFQTKRSLNINSPDTGSVAADVNGDGNLDLVSTGGIGITINFGQGDGSFKGVKQLLTGGSYSATVADLNGDGIADILAASTILSNSVSIYLGSGDGNFSPVTTVVVGNDVEGIATGDLNHDGILDLVSTDITDNTVSVLLGRGDGTFGTRATLAAGSGGYGSGKDEIRLADLNNDGNLDIIKTDTDDNTLSIFLGNGNGTFQLRTTVATSSGPSAVNVGDINGDGVLDLLSSDSLSNTVSVFLGRGDGTFQMRSSLASGQSPSGLVIADLNGDGALDVATADSTSKTNSVFIAKTRDGIGSLNLFSLQTKADALQSISLFDNKLKNLSAQRGQIGAFQSRIDAAINVLQSGVENYKAAESRIRDTDVAKDSSELTRLQILQQAGASVLGQANLQPKIALKLLQN